MTAVDVDALEAARAAATPGPWEVAGGRRLFYDNGCSEDVVAVRVEHSSGPWERIYVKRDDGTDAALIVAAVNALPELLAEVRRGRALREAVLSLAVRADVLGEADFADSLRALLAAVDPS